MTLMSTRCRGTFRCCICGMYFCATLPEPITPTPIGVTVGPHLSLSPAEPKESLPVARGISSLGNSSHSRPCPLPARRKRAGVKALRQHHTQRRRRLAGRARLTQALQRELHPVRAVDGAEPFDGDAA